MGECREGAKSVRGLMSVTKPGTISLAFTDLAYTQTLNQSNFSIHLHVD